MTYLAIGCFSFGLGALAVWEGFRIAVAAADDCGVFYDSGNEWAIGFAFLVSIVPAALLTCGFSLFATRVHPVVGLTTACLVAAAVVLLIVSTHAFGVAPISGAALVGPDSCPSGIPPWWPSWLPH